MWDEGHLGHLIYADHAADVAPLGWSENKDPDPLTAAFFPIKGM